MKVDWSKVPIDTKVMVTDDLTDNRSTQWSKRYFAERSANEAVYYVFQNGATSWSAKGRKNVWRRIKLAESVTIDGVEYPEGTE